MELTPTLIEVFFKYAQSAGLPLALLLVIMGYVWEVRRGIAREKAHSEFQSKMLEVIGEVKTAVSNGNLLLELLTRGRR